MQLVINRIEDFNIINLRAFCGKKRYQRKALKFVFKKLADKTLLFKTF